MQEKLAQAIEHRAAKRFDEAKALFAELYAENPDDPLVNYHYAWLHDSLGEERAAVPFYEKAIAGGLPDADLRGAMLGLGSTYRTLGEYKKAIDMLRRGMFRFPEAGEFPVFLAMALYNMGDHAEAMELLLKVIADTADDNGIQRFQRAIQFYSDKLDEVWT
ncbi:MAG: tetratricopeptide repeat protein [Anaerolineae bacterium]|nr:tetratricopeptide repeat protein [Anaerolineae bacterium]